MSDHLIPVLALQAAWSSRHSGGDRIEEVELFMQSHSYSVKRWDSNPVPSDPNIPL